MGESDAAELARSPRTMRGFEGPAKTGRTSSEDDIEDEGAGIMGRRRCPGRWTSGESGELKRSRGSPEGDWPRLIRLRGGSPSRESRSTEDAGVAQPLESTIRVEDASEALLLTLKPLDRASTSPAGVVGDLHVLLL